MLDWSSDWAASNADNIFPVPEVVEWVSWGFRGLLNASEIIVMIAWAIGAILIIGLAGSSAYSWPGAKPNFPT